MNRNNEDRLGINDRNTGAEAPQVPPPQPQNPNSPPQPAPALSFVAPTEFVELPSEGRFYSPDHPLHNVGVVEIKYMTAKEEDILTSQTLLKQGKALDRFIRQMLIDRTINIDSLLIGDKNAILIAARKSGYGAIYATQIVCPMCQSQPQFEFDLNDVTLISGSTEGLEDKVSPTDNGTFIIKELPITKWSVEVRPLDGRDERKLAEASEARKKKKLPEGMLTSQMLAFIVSINGITDKIEITNAISSMPAQDARELRAIYQKIIPNIDMTQNFTCTECEYSGDMEVPFTTDFFWPKQ